MSRPLMLTLTYKIIVLLQSLNYTSQILPPLYLSTYWQSTYVSDKVPDYWNHGVVYVPGLKETKKVDIFPAWVTKTSTESSSLVTEITPMEDYEIEIFKPSTDNVSSVNSADIEKNTGKLRADLAEDHSTTPMSQTELTSTVASELITRTAGTKTNSIIVDYFTTTASKSEKNGFSRPEYETSVDDFEAHRPSLSSSLIISSEEPKSYSIILDSMFTKRAPTPKKNAFTRPEFETTIDDDDAQPVSATKAISSTTPYETFDNTAHPNSTPMTHETPEYDSIAHPISTRMTQQISTPEYHTASYDDDATNYDYDTTKPTQEELSTTTTLKISSTKADLEPMIRAVNKEIPTDPFTVFLRKLMIVLSTKRLEDLPLLIEQFREYLWMLLTGGQIGKMGFYINSFLARQVIILDKLPAGVLRNYFNKFQKMLANRVNALPKDINNILDYMDDTYGEAEEEAMQAVLYEISRYPNTENKNKIAQGFVDFVFLNPMQRVMGTTRGKVLFGMITEALIKRQPPKEDRTRVPSYIGFRKNFKVEKKLKHVSDKNNDEESTLNKSYKRNNENREAKSDSSSYNLGGNSNIIKSIDDKNEHSDGTENKKTVESKYDVYKHNENIMTRNDRQHRVFTNVNRVTIRSRKTRKPLTRHRTLRYSVRNRQRILDDYVEIRGNTFSHKHPRTTTANSANFLETTDSGNIEMELKAKIYDTLRRMNLDNYNASRRMRQPIKSTVGVLDDSQETDVELVLKKNIYRAVKKILN